MATVEEVIAARLNGTAGLTALVASRIFWGLALEGTATPYVTFALVSAPRLTTWGADPGVVRARYQVSAWGVTADATKDVSEQVRAALQRYRGTVSGVEVCDSLLDNATQLFEPTTRLHHFALDFTIWHREN